VKETGLDIIKTWTVNGGVLAVTWLADIEAVLKILVLTVSLVWTVCRTYQLIQQIKKDKEQ